jgi:hypothetical protein
MTHAMSRHAKSVTTLTILKLQSFLNRQLVDSPLLGRTDQVQEDTSRYGYGRGKGKRPRFNEGGNNNKRNGGKKFRPDDHGDGPKGKENGTRKGKGIMRSGRRFNFHAMVKALSPKEQQRQTIHGNLENTRRDQQHCYECHKHKFRVG